MPRVSINEMTTYRWSFDEDVINLPAAGIGGIGVWRRKLTDYGEERGAELLRESGLNVTSLSSAGGFTGSDGHSFREALYDGLDALELAAEIKAGCLVVVTGGRVGHTLNHARRLAREALVELGDVGAEMGVEIAVQPICRQPIERWTFLTSLDATLDLLSRCDHPNVGMVFDLFHLWREPALIEKIPQLVPSIKVAAMCDARQPARSDDDRCLPGDGDVPLGSIVRALEAGGFRGWYDVQILCERAWQGDYERLIADCRKALEEINPELFVQRGAAPPPEARVAEDSASTPELGQPAPARSRAAL